MHRHLAVLLKKRQKIIETQNEQLRDQNKLIQVIAHDLDKPLAHIRNIPNILHKNNIDLSNEEQSAVDKLESTGKQIESIIQKVSENISQKEELPEVN